MKERMALLWILFRLSLTDRRIRVAFERGAIMDLSFIPDNPGIGERSGRASTALAFEPQAAIAPARRGDERAADRRSHRACEAGWPSAAPRCPEPVRRAATEALLLSGARLPMKFAYASTCGAPARGRRLL